MTTAESSPQGTPHLLTARYTVSEHVQHSATALLRDSFQPILEELHAKFHGIGVVSHQILPDGTPAPEGETFLTVHLDTDGSQPVTTESFQCKAKIAALGLPVTFIGVSQYINPIANRGPRTRPSQPCDNQEVVTQAPDFFR